MARQGTRALELLRRAGVEHRVHEYRAMPPIGRARDERPAYGLEAAAALGVAPDRVFKTIVVSVDGRLALAVVPATGEVDLRRVAAALGGRTAQVADPAAAERATGSVIGGISPLATRRPLPVVIDASAAVNATILVSAGRRGLQVELTPADLATLVDARTARILRTIGPGGLVKGTE